MNKKMQAGLEIMIIFGILILFTTGINIIFLKYNYNNAIFSQRESLISECMDLSHKISKVLIEKKMNVNFYSGYEFIFNSSAKLLIINSSNGIFSCALPSSRITNELGNKEFNINTGNHEIKNAGEMVVIK